MPTFNTRSLALALPLLLSIARAAPQAASNTAITCVSDGGSLYVLGGYTMTVASGVVCSDGQQVWPATTTDGGIAASASTDSITDSDLSSTEVNTAVVTTQSFTETETQLLTVTETAYATVTSPSTLAATDDSNSTQAIAITTTAPASAITTLGVATAGASVTVVNSSVVVENSSETYTTAVPITSTTQTTSSKTSTVASSTATGVFSASAPRYGSMGISLGLGAIGALFVGVLMV